MFPSDSGTAIEGERLRSGRRFRSVKNLKKKEKKKKRKKNKNKTL